MSKEDYINGTKKIRIKILTNSGYKYLGELVEKNPLFVILIDDRQGKIEVPLVNISLLQDENEIQNANTT